MTSVKSTERRTRCTDLATALQVASLYYRGQRYVIVVFGSCLLFLFFSFLCFSCAFRFLGVASFVQQLFRPMWYSYLSLNYWCIGMKRDKCIVTLCLFTRIDNKKTDNNQQETTSPPQPTPPPTVGIADGPDAGTLGTSRHLIPLDTYEILFYTTYPEVKTRKNTLLGGQFSYDTRAPHECRHSPSPMLRLRKHTSVLFVSYPINYAMLAQHVSICI